MKIGIDISQIVYEGTGVARFTHNLLMSLVESKESSNHSFSIFFSSLNNKIPESVIKLVENNRNSKLFRWPIPPRALSYLWGHKNLRNFLPTPFTDLDWFISSDWTEPPKHIAKRKMTIVHDCIFKMHPETVDPVIINAQTKRLVIVEVESDLVSCDSQTTLNDLKVFYPDIKAKLFVNYPGVTPLPIPVAFEFPYPFHPKKYFLSVGKIEPRKNIPMLVEAFEDFSKIKGHEDYQLVIVGPKGWDVSESHLDKPNVHLMGTVTDDDLGVLYTNAKAFVFPSLYEGFGIPLIEAMTMGCPAITSRNSSLAEISSDENVIYIDPKNKGSIVSAMNKIVDNPTLVQSMIEAGYQNAKKFTWERYTRILLEQLNSKL